MLHALQCGVSQQSVSSQSALPMHKLKALTDGDKLMGETSSSSSLAALALLLLLLTAPPAVAAGTAMLLGFFGDTVTLDSLLDGLLLAPLCVALVPVLPCCAALSSSNPAHTVEQGIAMLHCAPNWAGNSSGGDPLSKVLNLSATTMMNTR